MTKAKAKKAVAVATKPEGRLIDKFAIVDGALAIEGNEHSQAAADAAFGTKSRDFVTYSLLHFANIMKADDRLDLTIDINAAMAMLKGFAPSSEPEAILCAQMVVNNHLFMTTSNRMAHAQNLPQFQAYANVATKFSRTFTAQIEALSRLRRDGEQVVRHVHVNEGGQAVIAGTVNTGGGR
jgi:hypothetical protein